MTAKDRRKKFRIVHSLQIKYTLTLILPFFLIFLLIEMQMFYVIKSLLPHIEFLATKGLILKNIILIMVEVLILLIFAAIVNINYLHNIAGPLNRITKELAEMEKTKNYYLLTVRASDEIKPLINEFNKILSNFIKK